MSLHGRFDRSLSRVPRTTRLRKADHRRRAAPRSPRRQQRDDRDLLGDRPGHRRAPAGTGLGSPGNRAPVRRPPGGAPGHARATLGILLVVGRDDVTVEVALRGIATPLAVSEWRRLPPEVRRALPSAEDLTETVTRTVREVESAALQTHISKFVRELGVGWTFVGAEVPIQCGDRVCSVDLLFYPCELHPYEPEHVGQVNFYVQLVDDKLRHHQRDDHTLGILLVVGRDDVTVEGARSRWPR